MTAGSEIELTEEIYQQLIGRYVATIEVLNRRIAIKDKYIADLEAKPKPEGDHAP